MNAKEFLCQVRNLKDEVECKLSEIKHIKSTAARISGAYNAAPARASNRADEVEAGAAKLEKLRGDLSRDVSLYADKYAKVSAAIAAIKNPKHRALLRYRYLECMKWEEIAVKMNYSWRNLHYAHNAALKNIALFCTQES